MKRETFFTACMVMVASIIPFSSIMVANHTVGYSFSILLNKYK